MSALLLLFVLVGGPDEPVVFSSEELAKILTFAPTPLPPDPTNRVADDARAAELGQHLFFESRFSANGLVSCATCHLPERAFSDATPLSRGLEEVRRHTPTILNTAGQRWFFWDGRSDSLWAQALAPFEDAREFGGNRLAILRIVASEATLKTAYEQLFGPLPSVLASDQPHDALPLPNAPDDPRGQAWQALAESEREAVSKAFANLGKAIAAYERRLVAYNAPFDRFVTALAAGDSSGDDLLDPAQRRGLRLFIGKARCRNCHAGPNFSDGEFHDTGVPPLHGNLPKDAGRYQGLTELLENPFRADGPFSDAADGAAAQRLRFLQQKSDQWGQFKTPTLRNVARTAPYMHQGQLATLTEVLDFYNTLERQVRLGHHQDPLLQPLELQASELRDLIAFLESLTSPDPPAKLLADPRKPIRR